MNGSQFGMSLNGIIFLLIKIPYREYNMLTCSTAIYFQEKKNGGVSQCENLHFGRKKMDWGLIVLILLEPSHEKTNNLHRRKQ